ncbi:hypothetical protein G6F65_014906 [Rhizopus arrhizus]|nr:hypothetical protein G6F65_014906 [Rhizopus arrhizus]
MPRPATTCAGSWAAEPARYTGRCFPQHRFRPCPSLIPIPARCRRKNPVPTSVAAVVARCACLTCMPMSCSATARRWPSGRRGIRMPRHEPRASGGSAGDGGVAAVRVDCTVDPVRAHRPGLGAGHAQPLPAWAVGAGTARGVLPVGAGHRGARHRAVSRQHRPASQRGRAAALAARCNAIAGTVHPWAGGQHRVPVCQRRHAAAGLVPAPRTGLAVRRRPALGLGVAGVRASLAARAVARWAAAWAGAEGCDCGDRGLAAVPGAGVVPPQPPSRPSLNPQRPAPRAGLGRAMGVVLALAALPAMAAANVQQFSHGRFEQIPVHMPSGTPQRVVIWFHEPSAGGDTSRLPIEALRADGAMVAAVDIAHLRGVLKREGNPTCSFGSGDVENFSRWLQASLHLPGYHLPLVGGDGEGAEMAYSLAAQADTQVFAGLLTTGFCPDHSHERMVCGDGVKRNRLQPAELNFPWLSAAGDHGCKMGEASGFVQQVAMAREFKRTTRAWHRRRLR